MGNTVLTLLRKIKHPVIQRRVQSENESRYYNHWTSSAGGFAVLRTNTHYEIALEFKHNQENYRIKLYRDSFSMVRKRVAKFYAHTGYHMQKPEIVAELENIAYNDFEATIFQHSLLGELGMFGKQEAEMLLQLRNIYFGECDESTS